MPQFYVVTYKYGSLYGGTTRVLVTADSRREAIRQVLDSPTTTELGEDISEISASLIETLIAREEELADLKFQEEDEDAEAGT